MENTPLNWQEIIRSLASGAGAVIVWFGGKFIFNRWEKRRMETENEIKERQAEREASETVSVFSKVAQDTGQSNMDLRKKINELLEWGWELDRRVHGLELTTVDLQAEKTRLADRNRKLEDRVKILEETLRANNIAIPLNGG